MTKKQVHNIFAVCLLLAIFFILVSGQTIRNASGKTVSPLTGTFLKVGKADAIVLENGGYTMVIDTGEEDDGEELVEFLKNRKIDAVDVLIITHYDKDHVGGADTLLSEIPVGRVLIPDYAGTTTEYTDFLAAMNRASIEPERISSPLSFAFGDAAVEIDPPKSYEAPDPAVEYDNNFSLVTTVTHGNNRLLFTGDIEKARVLEMLESGKDLKCDFLKFPHHGIYHAALEDFLQASGPRYAVITCSDKNPPDDKTLELLQKYGVDVLETRRGKVHLISDGADLELRQKAKR